MSTGAARRTHAASSKRLRQRGAIATDHASTNRAAAGAGPCRRERRPFWWAADSSPLCRGPASATRRFADLAALERAGASLRPAGCGG